jgi:uncharacterized protein
MSGLRALALAASICVVVGCAAHREFQHVYALDTAFDVSRNTDTVFKGPDLQLQRVLVPDYLDTTELVLRVGAHEIRESSTGRFGERLSLGITHALRSDLAVLLPLDIVALAHPTEKSARQILVTVDEFDVWQNARCVLVANWSILSSERRAVPASDRATFTAAPVGGIADDAAIVSAMADVVRQLADRIAYTVQALPP